MKVSRRTFLKASAAASVGAAASSQIFKPVGFGQQQGAKREADKEDWVPTTCWIGKQDCGMLARRINGRVVKLEGNPLHPRNVGTLCPKGQAQIMAMYDPNRVKAPLVRTNEKGVPGK